MKRKVCEPGRTYYFQPHSPLSSITDSSGVVTSSHWSRAPVDEVAVIAGEPGVRDSRVLSEVSTVGLLALATNMMEAFLQSSCLYIAINY